MLTLRVLVARYAFFALVATALNLATQRLVFALVDESHVFVLAIGAGTAVGLIVKYILDKRWIFYDRSSGIEAHGRRLPLYVAAGLATTAIFWGFEALFWFATHNPLMRDLGAIIGLSIGYVTKYQLDRRFVFTSQAA